MLNRNAEMAADKTAVIEAMAREQMLFLADRYKMNPQEIIHLYTGEKPENATYQAALHSIVTHRATAEFAATKSR